MLNIAELTRIMNKFNVRTMFISKDDWYNCCGYNDYYLDVNLAGLECRDEVGDNFSWGWCAQLAGCCASTAKKYYSKNFEVPSWYIDELHKQEISKIKTNATKDIPNFITNQPILNYVNPSSLSEYMKGHITFHSLDRVPDATGVYMIGQTYFVEERNEIWMLIKVGKAINLKERLKRYNTHNPTYNIIDLQLCSENKLDEIESYYHQAILFKGGVNMGDNQEWFIVSKDFYDKIKLHGFKGLKK